MATETYGTDAAALHEQAGLSSGDAGSNNAPQNIQTAQAGTPNPVNVSAAPAATVPAAQPLVLKAGPDNTVTLPQGTSLAQIEVDGANIVLVQPDGSRIVIEGGALDVPTFVIGEVQIPQEALVAAFETSGVDVAAGPEGISIVSSPNSGGSNFGEPLPGIGDAGPVIDLLDPTALEFDGPEQPELFNDIVCSVDHVRAGRTTDGLGRQRSGPRAGYLDL